MTHNTPIFITIRTRQNWPARDPQSARISEVWKQQYFLRIRDLLTQYRPDLWYTDGPLSFGKVGLSLLAHQ